MSNMRIIEWNVGKRVNRKPITEKLKSKKADIIFLTEVTLGINDYIQGLSGYRLVAKEYIQNSPDNKVLCFAKDDLECWEHEIKNDSNRPNMRMISFQKSGIIYKVLGVRFCNSGLTRNDKLLQKDKFIDVIKKKKPDIIIGDFNINSALSVSGEYFWSAAMSDIKDLEYDYVDACNKGDSFSFQSQIDLRNKNIGTAPDVVFIKKHSSIYCKDAQYSWCKDCNTDHAMLITDVVLKNGKTGKLVRDKIPDIIKGVGKKPITRTLSEEEYLTELDKKLDEEVAEYQSDKTIEEMADILEVLYAICEAKGHSIDELHAIRSEKANKRGKFADKIYWEGNE